MLARGFCTRTLCNLKERNVSDGYNRSIVSEDISETNITSSLPIENTMIWN